jgi:hypothetical protein
MICELTKQPHCKHPFIDNCNLLCPYVLVRNQRKCCYICTIDSEDCAAIYKLRITDSFIKFLIIKKELKTIDKHDII